MTSQRQLLTCFPRLLLRVLDDMFVPLLAPNLVVVLHATGFVHLRLLNPTLSAGATYDNMTDTHSHLWFLEVLAAPVVEPALERKHITEADASPQAENDVRVHGERTLRRTHTTAEGVSVMSMAMVVV